jgi:hypothetical protein
VPEDIRAQNIALVRQLEVRASDHRRTHGVYLPLQTLAGLGLLRIPPYRPRSTP